MQLLLLKADKEEKGQSAQGSFGYTSGMLGTIFLYTLLVFLLSAIGWKPGPAWLDLHTSSVWFILAQTLLLSFVCWLCTLVCSFAGRYRHPSTTLSHQRTTRAIYWLILYPGIVLAILTLFLLLFDRVRGHPWPAPLLAFLLLLVVLRLWPSCFNLFWLLARLRRPKALIGTTLVDFSSTPPDPALPLYDHS
ncbi:MAG TPA: hypothetical protein VN729_09140 [Ktedonobacteraceae bacterium]|nr:hypothetical protein [Ktedonobacteraceae bacterium]